MPQLQADWLHAQPLAQAHALPAPFYTDPGIAALERDTVFRRSWQLVAHAAQLAAAGDHVIADLAGLPLLVVRGEDDVLRALHNVCRHRAGPIAHCDGRGARKLVCRYHGWTYELDGRLRGAPEMKGAPQFDVAGIRLPEARAVEWQGLVFAAAGDAPPFDEVVAGIDARVAAQGLGHYAFAQRVSYDIACNWKVYVDNFLEGYHLPIVHPGLNRLLDYRSYVTELAAWHSLQWSPLETDAGAANFYGSGEALYYFIYPNTMLNILPGRLQTNRVLPLGADRCRVQFDYHYPADAGDDTTRRAQDAEFSEQVQQEDIAICEAVQRGLASGSYHAGRLNPLRESGVHHFHELLRAAWRAA